jgi:hypothetical protein
VPAQQSLWLDEQQRVPPIRDHDCETDEDEPVNGPQLWALDTASSDDELLAKQSVLGEELLARACKIDNETSDWTALG